MKLGSRVRCDGYVKKSGNYFILIENKTGCVYWDKSKGEGVRVEDYLDFEKFTMTNAPFYGIYVGTTNRCTVLRAEYGISYNQEEYFSIYGCKPKQFAIVYYAKNRKRLVPIDMVLEMEE